MLLFLCVAGKNDRHSRAFYLRLELFEKKQIFLSTGEERGSIIILYPLEDLTINTEMGE